MPKCEICGKTRIVGNRVSHSNIKLDEIGPNVQRVRAVLGNTTSEYMCAQSASAAEK